MKALAPELLLANNFVKYMNKSSKTLKNYCFDETCKNKTVILEKTTIVGAGVLDLAKQYILYFIKTKTKPIFDCKVLS